MRRSLRALAFACCVLGVSTVGAAAPGEFQRALEALERKDAKAAIVELEALADLGTTHPSISFNRGIAYFLRANSPDRRPGDLGQAAAAFAETRLLRPGDEEAARLLEETQLAIARSRGTKTSAPVLEVTPLGARVLNYLAFPVLYGLSALGALLGTLGLLLRLSRTTALKTTGLLFSVAGAVLFAAAASLFWTKSFRQKTHLPAVVVSERAYLADELGRPLKGAEPLSEGASVEVFERKGRLACIETETGPRYVPLASLRFLARPKSP